MIEFLIGYKKKLLKKLIKNLKRKKLEILKKNYGEMVWIYQIGYKMKQKRKNRK
jgi:hypothetical protein